MPVAAVAAVVGATAAVAGTAASISNQNRALKAQRQQNRYERQINQNRVTRERRDAIRTARLASGAVTNTAANQGAMDSSSYLGGAGSIQSQLRSNLSFLDTQQGLADQASEAAGRASQAQGAAQMWAGVSQAGMAVFGNRNEIAGVFK